ncbi:MAG: dynamin family protein [Actinomycetota bacterium]|nr:dynamin family protein [Actinomycetota bacterium]
MNQRAQPRPRSKTIDNLLGAVDSAAKLADDLDRDDLRQRIRTARERLESATFHVLVVGEFKQGKSSLINALLRHQVCPVDDDVATARPIAISYADSPWAQVQFKAAEGEAAPPPQPVPVESIRNYATEFAANPDPREVEGVEVGVPSPILNNGIVLVDTPGVGGLGSAHSTVTVGALPMANAVVFVSDASQEFTQPELDFMRTALAMCPNLVCVITKTDFYPAWRKIVDLDRQHLARNRISAEIIPTSASLRQHAVARQDKDLNNESGYPDLIKYLRQDIATNAEQLLARQSAAEILEILDQLEKTYSAEIAVLDDPDRAQDVVDQLKRARENSERLRGQASRWQQTLSDGHAELVSDVAHDLRGRMREMVRQSEEAIDNSDPADTWPEFEPWLYNRTATEVVHNYTFLHHRSVELSRLVGEHFLVDHEEIAGQLEISNPYDLTQGAGVEVSLEIKPMTAGSQALSAMRGGYGGFLMFSLMGGLLGIPGLQPVALAVGVVMGRRQLREEKQRQLNQRRMQAKQAVRRYTDDVQFSVTKDCQDNLRRIRNQLRDFYTSRAEDLNKSTTESLNAAEQAVKRDNAGRQQRKKELVAHRQRIQQLRAKITEAMGQPAPAGTPTGA